MQSLVRGILVMSLKLEIIFYGLVLLVSACTAEPDADTKACSLDCSRAKIAGSEASVMVISPDMSVTCESPNYDNPTVVVAEVAFFMSYNEATVGAQAGANSRITVPAKQPIPGAAFYPLISGSNAGIITPKDKWCTDTCGIARISFAAVCPTAAAKGTGALVQLLSGAAGTIDSTIKTSSWKIDMKAPETSSTP